MKRLLNGAQNKVVTAVMKHAGLFVLFTIAYTRTTCSCGQRGIHPWHIISF